MCLAFHIEPVKAEMATLAAPIIVVSSSTIEPFGINITVADVQNLCGYQFVLNYNTSILNALDAGSYTPFNTGIVLDINDTAGYVSMAYWTYFGDPNGFSTADPTPIAWVEFTVEDSGTSMLDLNGSIFSDPLGNPIQHEEVDGFFSTTIQKAIDYAFDGDAISVKNGTYYEHLFINKTVSLIGENPETTIIDGNGTASTDAIYIEKWGRQVEIDGFTIQNGRIHIYESYGNNITNCNLRSSGLFLDWYVDDTFVANVSASHGGGFTVMCGNNMFSNCTAFSNGGTGFSIYRSYSGTTILNCNSTRNSGDGFFVGFFNNVDIRNSTASDNGGAGFCVNNGGYSRDIIESCSSTGNEYGISIYGSQDVDLRGNKFDNNTYNVRIGGYSSSEFNKIYIDTSNTVNGKPMYYLKYQQDLVIDASTFPDVGYLGLVSSNNITVRDLSLSKNHEGILLAYSNDSTIENVQLSDNALGIASYGSVNNTFYHNSFLNNTVQASIGGGLANTWNDNYPSGGNYWNDYAGADMYRGPYQNITGSDGIGDTPYVIDANNTDYYPLMKPYGGTHDVGIDNITRSKIVVGQGYNLSISIKIINYGFQTETFNLTVYANIVPIQSITDIALSSRNSTVITFTWNTTGFAYGNYTIKAEITTVPGETDTTDNTYVDNIVLVTIPGDCNGDKTVNILDIGCISAHWYPGPPVGPLGYHPNADADGDGAVDIFDIGIASAHWGESW